MQTVRVEHRQHYTVVDSQTVNDRSLSLRALGLLLWLLDKPDGWRVNSTEIARQHKEGRDAIRSALRELEDAGYLTRHKYRGEGGTWVHDAVLSERSFPETQADTGPDDDRGLENRRRLTGDWKSDGGFSGAITKTKSKERDKEITTFVILDETDIEKENCAVNEKIVERVVPLSRGSDLALVSVEKMESNATIAENVMDAWVEATGRVAGRVKLNAKRRSAIAARIKEGYTESDLIAAARGISMSAWHTGDNPEGKKFDDLLVAIRDGERVERFRDLFEAGGDRGKMSATDQVMALYAQDQT